ncbi:MAG TPA: heavy-metal-associated domain-containing protein [Gemmatimonadaceae bacterium]|nr:heavy-metal-associated domain-containing protein [Gemmatimonadaceae bacterium]
MAHVSNTSATLSITGMTCGHCIANVRAALQSVPGVADTEVARGTATFQVDARDRDRVVARAIEAIAVAGYAAAQVDG